MKKHRHQGSKVRLPGFLKEYPALARLDGRHPLRKAVPDGYVDYKARTRKGGRLCFFNYALAREMGLIPRKHPDQMNPSLKKTLLYVFGIQIINEYDIAHQLDVPAREQRPYPYMATRYLQLQHADKMGLSSGDGRGIWNGCFKGRNGIWDVSSSGTGATCLSPAFSAEQEFIKTGDKVVAYGNGRADIIDGVSSAVMSEIFHQNRIRTERVLALIEYADGTSVNVRAYPNLMRPAHLFYHLKQNNFESLERAVGYYLEREAANGAYSRRKNFRRLYDDFLKTVCKDFAKSAAKFENEYIFCWMDWDGDNILMNGAIIDYGSVRQFGLYHHEYRYDDVDKMSTSIKEQKLKARYTVQTFIQLIDFLKTGSKKPIGKFSRDPVLSEFDRQFERSRLAGTLYKMGFEAREIRRMLKSKSLREKVREFQGVYGYFEMASARKGFYKVLDGITRDAIFCMRDLMRELPRFYLQGKREIDARTFIDILRSEYASKRDLRLSAERRRKIEDFQRLYHELVEKAARIRGTGKTAMLKMMSRRSDIINRYERVTGDGVLHVTQKLLSLRKKISHDDFYQLIQTFVAKHILRPESLKQASGPKGIRNKNVLKVFRAMIRVVKESREGL